MRTNVKSTGPKTHEGAPAKSTSALQLLRRSVLACLLWEDSFYEDGVSIADRIAQTVGLVKPEDAAALAIEARGKYKLRHVPQWIVVSMLKHPAHRTHVRKTVEQTVQRADELAEILALYWKDGKKPLPAQLKKGLRVAFQKFDSYQLGKYKLSDKKVKTRDVLRMTHPKPLSPLQSTWFKGLNEGTLETPDTWETNLSAGKDKKGTWERLITEKKLGSLALLRNLRNMHLSGVSEDLVFKALDEMKVERILPFRFITAARHAPQWESHLEKAMLKCLDGREKLPGKTALLVDVSGSMNAAISSKSDLSREDAANGLAILARELCEKVAVYSFSNRLVRVPDRRGFALRDAIHGSQAHGGTWLGRALGEITEPYDRIIVITDEQSHDSVGNPKGKGYMINVAAYRNGVGYGDWTHVDGWSEAVFDYIVEVEK